ncbi:MAG: LutB/LldF family L-lactate oxidation iron-sulfur protein [Thermodesulfobacteriota bacterium]
MIDNFKTSSVKALENKKLTNVLRTSTDRFRLARKNAIEQVENWEELRAAAREIKKEVIDNLDKYLVQLEESVKRVGGEVHWARDAHEASKIIIDIAKENGVKRVVKSKSMATEEIELNSEFSHNGIKSVETDLGEYILQISNDHPFHIITPAIHKTKDDIARLFSEKFNIPKYDDPQKITDFARSKLRDEFLSADMGVSGVNFAVAETGTIVIVENEGNARLSTTVPKIHVALMGIEKIVPEFGHLSIFLSLLARSATGQGSSTYVSLITGPKRKGDIDGPFQFHLVLLDNGRSDILKSDELRESLYCIRCGACLNICPVYRQVGGHSYSNVYSGPIGAIITPQLESSKEKKDLPFASSLCGACKDVCPVKINFPHVLLSLRNKIKSKESSAISKFEKLNFVIWKLITKNPKLYNLFNNIAAILQKLFKKDEKLQKLPYPFSNWTKERDFPVIADIPFRKRWENIKKVYLND